MSKYIRILPKRHYYKDLGRFASLAFKNLKGGISIIRKSCISDTGNQICKHLNYYYKSVDAPPHIVWIFDINILPPTAIIKRKDSHTGDKCHYNIKGLSNNLAKRIFSANFDLLDSGKICNNEHPRKFTDKDFMFFENKS